MSKYDPLWKYLLNNGSDLVRLSFGQIKDILGFEIDHSFLNAKKDAAQFGYKTEKISLKEQYVIFIKMQ